MKTFFLKMINLPINAHYILAFVLRIVLVVYANFHDKTFAVPYTDIDYKVFTDAARHMVHGKSPFDRHTYRYTPLLAMLLSPNIFLCHDFGKLLFSTVDIFVAILINQILTRNNCTEGTKRAATLMWLYNPLTVVISTRGNADSLAVLLVVSTLDSLQRRKFILAGLLHGLSIHFRLYPVVFSAVIYFSLNKSSYFLPNKNQLALVCSCLLSLICLTGINYCLYGYRYLYESLLYHMMRKDARHNFSVYFYMLYLSADQAVNLPQKILTFLPQLMLLFILSFRYSSPAELPFAMFAQAMVMVTYNPVLTSQYFFWFLSLLPLCLPNFRFSILRSVTLCCVWILSQALWLFAAYMLEFQGLNSFISIWFCGLLFFIVNIVILKDMIVHYKQ